MQRTYILLDQDSRAVQCVVLDEDIQNSPSAWVPPQGHRVERHDGPWAVGWLWDGKRKALINPNPPSTAPDAD